MKFTVQPADLKKAFSTARMALASKNAMPVLENIKIEPAESENQVKMTASDGDNTIVVLMSVEDTEDMRPVLVPAEFLGNLVGKALSEWPVTFEFGENGQITVSDLIGEFKVFCADKAEDYPVLKPLKEPNVVTISTKRFVETSMMAIGYAEDDVAKNTYGVNYNVDGDTLWVAATDAKKLYIDYIHGVSSSAPVSFTLAKKTVSSIAGLIGCEDEIKLSVTGDKICIESENLVIYGRLREGKYPRVLSVIQKTNNCIAVVDNKKLSAAIERVLIASSSSTHQVVMTFNGSNSVKIESEDIDFGRSAQVTCETVSQSGINAEFKIGYRGDNIQKVLSSLKSEGSVAILMSDPYRAALIKSNPDAERLFLLMPMQVAQK